MNTVKFSGWIDDEDNILNIYRVKDQIKSFIKKLKKGLMEKDSANMLYKNIYVTLNYWTGYTYVGKKKTNDLEKAFQSFYLELYDLLLLCHNGDFGDLTSLSNAALYQGYVYRFLGNSSKPINFKDRTVPVYNDIYVSWSKNSSNQYIEGKLLGTITKLTCLIEKPYYGIDLTVFNVSKGDEEEVVFPTIEKMIENIEYINIDL